MKKLLTLALGISLIGTPAFGVPTLPVDSLPKSPDEIAQKYKPRYIPGLPAVDWSKLEDKKPKVPWTVRHAAETSFLATTGLLGGFWVGIYVYLGLLPIALISAQEGLTGRRCSLRDIGPGPELVIIPIVLGGMPAFFRVLIKRMDGSPLHPIDKAICGIGTFALAGIVLGKLAAYKNI